MGASMAVRRGMVKQRPGACTAGMGTVPGHATLGFAPPPNLHTPCGSGFSRERLIAGTGLRLAGCQIANEFAPTRLREQSSLLQLVPRIGIRRAPPGRATHPLWERLQPRKTHRRHRAATGRMPNRE
ncbi:hypothetical protein TUM18999_34820 [Pseudomonas tohonis]|uniref:Uncharacterized protein n=1 Tax=Pseudomonas tohonis TaxID=2725477 RepID=A0A6J4E9T4_9PSED|nr:hypothetical protein TUM18999_34820 [Pseudomonas tohonis]GJN56384.1 hypothetical protein TUM20286_61360 [Pseudomonas tohonis]